MDEPRRFWSFGIRLQAPLYSMLRIEADKHFRSLSREIALRLHNSFERKIEPRIELVPTDPEKSFRSFGIRLPYPLYELLRLESEKHFRSLSKEIALRLYASFENTNIEPKAKLRVKVEKEPDERREEDGR